MGKHARGGGGRVESWEEGACPIGRPKTYRKWWSGGSQTSPRKPIRKVFFRTKQATKLSSWYPTVRKCSIRGEGRWFLGRNGVFVGAYWFCRGPIPARSVGGFFGTNGGVSATFCNIFWSLKKYLHCALLLDYVPQGTPLGKPFRMRDVLRLGERHEGKVQAQS